MSGPLIGIDLGMKRTGLAICDDGQKVAVPLLTLEKERKDSDRIRRIRRMAEQRGAVGFVLGLPLNMDGTEGEMATWARAFGQKLSEKSGLPVTLVDERLTSAEAREGMSEVGASETRQKELVDQVAASLILQSWLDQQT